MQSFGELREKAIQKNPLAIIGERRQGETNSQTAEVMRMSPSSPIVYLLYILNQQRQFASSNFQQLHLFV
jgi:hypothetical protein